MSHPKVDQGRGDSEHKRVAWVDCARVLGIFFVCQVHSTAAMPNPILSKCAVCMFFLLAGYFNTKLSVVSAIKRSAIFFVSYCFWVALGSTLSHAGVIFSLAKTWDAICYAPYPMWFIKYMIVLLPVGAALNYIPIKWRAALGVVLFILSFVIEPVWDIMPLSWERLTVNTHPTYVLFLFLVGGILRVIPLDQLPKRLFPGAQQYRMSAVCLGAIILCGLLAWSTSKHELPALQVWHLIGIWALMFISYAFELAFPSAAHIVAKSGPAVILIYLCNPLILRIFASAYMNAAGELPSPILSMAVCVFIITACTVAYRALIGRSKVLDIVLFAR